MSKLRWGLIPLAVVASLGATTAVFGKSEPKAKASATITLNLLASNPQAKPTNNMIAGFEKANPDIQIKTTYTTGSGPLGQLLTTQINAGNPPDIVYLNPGNAGLSGVVPLAKAGRLADLSKEAWVKKLPKGLKPAGMYNGKTYSFPFSSYLTGAIYNKGIFKKAGVKVPTTMAAMISACKAIKSKTGVIPIGLALAEPGVASAEMLGVFTKYVDPSFNTLKAKGKTSYASSAAWKKTYATLSKMKAAGCFSAGAAGTTAAQAQGDVLAGRSAMYFYVNVTLGSLKVLAAAQGQDLAFMAIPGDSAKHQKIPVSSTTYGVTSKNNVEAAKKFIAYLAVPANNNGFNKISGGISNLNLAKGKLPAGNEAVVKIAKSKGGLIPAWYLNWPNANAIFYIATQFQGWFTGQRSPSQILTAMDYLWKNPTASAPPG